MSEEGIFQRYDRLDQTAVSLALQPFFAGESAIGQRVADAHAAREILQQARKETRREKEGGRARAAMAPPVSVVCLTNE